MKQEPPDSPLEILVGLGLLISVIVAFVLTLAACGRGPACPRLSNGGAAPAPPACPAPSHADIRACEHWLAQMPRLPVFTGYASIDRIRLDEHEQKMSNWQELGKWACGESR